MTVIKSWGTEICLHIISGVIHPPTVSVDVLKVGRVVMTIAMPGMMKIALFIIIMHTSVQKISH